MLRLVRWWVTVIVLLVASPTLAVEPEGDRAQELADQLESPFCPGRTISSCTSPAAAEWRTDIQTWVGEGVASEEIRTRLSERAGRDLRFVPQDGSFYGLLAVGAVLSVVVLGLITRRVRRRDEAALVEAASESEPSPADLVRDAELDRRLDDELADAF